VVIGALADDGSLDILGHPCAALGGRRGAPKGDRSAASRQ